MYEKVVKFSFKRQKILWVLVFSFMYLVLDDAMDRSIVSKSVVESGSDYFVLSMEGSCDEVSK